MTINQIQISQEDRKRNRVGQFLFAAHASIEDVGMRRQARLLSSLLFAFALLSSVRIVVAVVSGSLFTDPSIPPFFVLVLSMFGAYLLSRTKVYLLSGVIALSAFSALIWVIIIISGDSNPFDILGSGMWLVLSVLLGGLLFPWWGGLIWSIANIIPVFIIPNIVSGLEVSNLTTVWSMMIVVTGLILTLNRNRDLQEADRRGQLIAVNRELEDLSASLEIRVHEAVENLSLAAEVGRRVSLVRDTSTILTEAAEMIRDRFDLYYTQIYLTDTTGRSLILRSGTGDVGRLLIQRSHRLPVDLSSINGIAATEQRPVIVSDTAASETHRPNPLLPDTRSEMAIPLIAGERVVGVLDVQSSQPGKLSEDNLAAFEALAGQLAITIVNAKLFADIEQTRRDFEAQARRLTHDGWDDYLNAIDEQEYVGYNYEDSTITPLLDMLDSESKEDALVKPIQVSGESIGTLKFVGDRPWTEDDNILVDVVSRQVAQQVENLRLLAQSERYQAEAQQALRRLTREGWSTYQDTRNDIAFAYKDFEVKPFDKNGDIGEVVSTFPIKVNEVFVGEFGIVGKERISNEDAEIMNIISERLSTHLDGLRLAQQTEQALSETEAMLEITSIASSSLELQSTLAQVLNKVLETTTAVSGLISVFNPQTDKLEIVSHKLPKPFLHKLQTDGLDGTLCDLVYQREETIIVEDLSVESPIDATGLINLGFQAYQGVPLESKGTVVGTICIFYNQVIFAQEATTTLMEVVGQQIAIAIENANLFEQTQKRAAEMATVSELGTTITTILDTQEMIETVVDLAKERFNLYHAHIYMMDSEGKNLVLAAGAGEIGRQMVGEGWRIPLDTDTSLVAKAARKREGVIVNDVRADLGFMENPLLPNTASELAVPLIAGGQVLGVLDVQSDKIGYFTEEDISIQTTLASQVAVALQNAETYARTQRQAEHESLINVISQRISSTTDIENALQVAVRELGRALGAKRTSVHLGGRTNKK